MRRAISFTLFVIVSLTITFWCGISYLVILVTRPSSFKYVKECERRGSPVDLRPMCIPEELAACYGDE